MAVPPICQGPGRRYLLDLTPSQHCLHPSCLANEQPEGGWGLSERRSGERDPASGKGDSQPLGRNLPTLVRQLTRLSTFSETQSERG